MANAKPTLRTNCSESPRPGKGEAHCIHYTLNSISKERLLLNFPFPTCTAESLMNPLSACFLSSPSKSEFIKAKYQMLAFVHRMPCREDDSSTAKDLSKVRRKIKHKFFFTLYFCPIYLYISLFSSNSTRASAQGIWRLVCGCCPSERRLTSFTLYVAPGCHS